VSLCANWHTIYAVQAANSCQICCVHVNSCLVEPQCYDAFNKKTLVFTPMYKQVNNDNLASMTTPDQHELDAAWLLCIDALQAVQRYTFDQGDFEAASVAVLCKAIELTAKKEVEICYKQSGSTLTN